MAQEGERLWGRHRPSTVPPNKREKVEEGIRKDRYGYETYIKVSGFPQVSKRFPFNAQLNHMRLWREKTRQRLQLNRRIVPMPKVEMENIARAPAGWCYVYFIRSDDYVKIGCTDNPLSRMARLQTGHHSVLTMLAAIPAHQSLETALHNRFAALRQNGEWFLLHDELVDFIERAKMGANPFALLWGELSQPLNLNLLLNHPPPPLRGQSSAPSDTDGLGSTHIG